MKNLKPEEYRVLCLSTAHYRVEDDTELAILAKDSDMIFARMYGFFIKLYSDMEFNEYAKLSNAVKAVIYWAFHNGYRMIEFDCDADKEEGLFPVFNW